MQHYLIKFVSDLRQVGGFLRFSPPNKTDRHDISEILLKVALSTVNQTKPNRCCAQNAQKPEREGLPPLLRMSQILHV